MTPSPYRLLALACVAALARPAAAGFTVTGGSSNVMASATFDQTNSNDGQDTVYPAATGFSYLSSADTGGSSGAAALASQTATVPTTGAVLTATGSVDLSVDAGGSPGLAAGVSAFTAYFTLADATPYTYVRSSAVSGTSGIVQAVLSQFDGSDYRPIWLDNGVFSERSQGVLAAGQYELTAQAEDSVNAGPAGGNASFVVRLAFDPAAAAPAAVPAPGGLALAAAGAAGLVGRAVRRRAGTAGDPPGPSGPG